MNNKDKITISISKELLEKVDEKIDKINFKNRSHVIESLVGEGLRVREDIGAIIIAHERRWNEGEYPLVIPKALIQIDGKTLIEKHLETLKKANIEKCVIAIGHEGKQIKDFLKNKYSRIQITFCEFDELDKSQKVICECAGVLGTNKCLVILGDNYFHDFNLTDFICYHNTNNTNLSMVVKTIDVSHGYGNVKLEGNNIVKFVEKPKNRDDISFIVNTGIYLLPRALLPTGGKNVKIEDSFFADFIGCNNAKAYFHNGKWFHLQDNETLHLFYK